MTESSDNFFNVPKDFLKDVFIIPHNFDEPEKKEHAIFVHEQTRHDLFYDAYEKVANVEIKFLKKDDDYFRLKKIGECGEDDFLERTFTKKNARIVII